MRKCKQCKTEIKLASKCTDIVEKKGFCSIECLYQHAKSARLAKEKRELKKKKRELKTLNELKDESQKAFNAFIRERDKGLSCISCGKPDHGVRHASHYRSVGGCSYLRYDESNVHASCDQCNTHKSGNISEYTPRLIEKIGIDEYERITNSPKSRRYSRDELIEIKKKYQKKKKDLQSRRDCL